MAVDFEALVTQAKQLSKTQRARLIAELSADLAREVQLEEDQARGSRQHTMTLEELLEEQNIKPFEGFTLPSNAGEDEEVDEFLRWRKLQRQRDIELSEQRYKRISGD